MMSQEGEEQERMERIEAAQGVSCPVCGCKYYKTTHTRHIPYAVRRRHVCRHCGKSFHSIARLE